MVELVNLTQASKELPQKMNYVSCFMLTMHISREAVYDKIEGENKKCILSSHYISRVPLYRGIFQKIGFPFFPRFPQGVHAPTSA